VQDLERHIAELETKAAEFKLIADLATNPDARAANTRRAQELLNLIEHLKQQSEAA
jgi:hypothetical protein